MFAKQEDATVEVASSLLHMSDEEILSASEQRNRGRHRSGMLKRREVTYDLSAVEKQAISEDGEPMDIGEDVSEQFERKPFCLFVLGQPSISTRISCQQRHRTRIPEM